MRRVRKDQRRVLNIAFLNLGDGAYALVSDCARGVEKVMGPDLALHIACVAEGGAEAFDLIRERNCDAAVVRITSPEMAKAARSAGFPMVNVSSWVEFPRVASVRRDDQGAGRMAVEHLASKGFRRILCVSTKGPWTFGARFEGAMIAAEEAGIQVRTIEHEWGSYFTTPGEFEELKRQLCIPKPPLGVVCIDDYVAPMVMTACRESSLQIPRDVGLVCTVNTPGVVTNEHMPCSISSPDVDQKGMLVLAGEVLARQIIGEDLADSIFVVPVRGVVERESTRHHATDDPLVAEAIAIINDRFAQGLNVTQVIEELAVSASKFKRRFKPIVGVTPAEYIARVRVAHAKELLKDDPGLTLQQVAHLSGFHDQRRLTAAFHRLTGQSAKAFRKANART